MKLEVKITRAGMRRVNKWLAYRPIASLRRETGRAKVPIHMLMANCA